MKQLPLFILAGLTILVIVSFFSNLHSLAQSTSPQPTGIANSLLNLSSNGDTQLLLEADLADNDESANPQLLLRQDGGKVSSGLGFQEATNDLELINYRGKAKLILKENGSICLGVSC